MASDSSLSIGHRIRIVISDPWELRNVHGENVFTGVVEALRSLEAGHPRDAVLVRLDEPMEYGGRSYPRAAISGRGRLSVFKELEVQPVECGLLGIRGDEDAAYLEALESWRGGLAANALVSRLPGRQESDSGTALD